MILAAVAVIRGFERRDAIGYADKYLYATAFLRSACTAVRSISGHSTRAVRFRNPEMAVLAVDDGVRPVAGLAHGCEGGR